MRPLGTPALEAVEEFYGDSIERVTHHLHRRLVDLDNAEASVRRIVDELRCGEFLTLYLDQVQALPLSTWLDGVDDGDGALRASIVGRELAAGSGSRRRSIIIDGEHYGADHLPRAGIPPDQLKAALCYASDVLVEDPFDEEQVLRDFLDVSAGALPGLEIEVAPDPAHFVGTLSALAALAPAVRARHVAFVPRRLAMDSRQAGRLASNAWSAFGTAEEELARRSLRLWLATGGLVTPMFADDDEEQRFADGAGLLGLLINDGEAVRLRRIAHLALPTVGDLDVAAMVTIRQDDAFEAFRARQRRALAAIGDGTDEAARREYRADMRDAARDLAARLGQRRSFRSLLSKVTGWGIGALVLTPDGWRAAVAALGGLTTEVIADRVLGRDGRDDRALLQHYATLGGAPEGLR